ncbi:MAG: biotin transporter BioY [Eubacterium sp.]|nr:biotin transporter BioY [Eubacterium sp.]
MSESMKSTLDLRMTVCCALFTALIIIGGYISIPIPIGPVPIALADFFVMLAGLFLGAKYGLACTVLYLVLGALGLPVFAGGSAGLAILFGPTGGFLFGYLLTAASSGAIVGKKPNSPHAAIRILAALLVGNILLYTVGVPWLKIQMGLSWPAALAGGLTPFIPGIVIKIAAAVTIARLFLPRFQQTMYAAQESRMER